MQQKKKSGRRLLHRIAIAVCILLICVISVVAAVSISGALKRMGEGSSIAVPEAITTEAPATTAETTAETTKYPGAAARTTETVSLDDFPLLTCKNAALIEVTDSGNLLLAERDADAVIYPASLTKIMTMLTFLDVCTPEQLDSTTVMDAGVLDSAHAKLAACAGFYAGEVCTVRDLLYGMMLPSGADAALMLAKIASGSEEAFAAEMNRLAAEMGLRNSHFVNCTGLHDPAHVSSAQDIARMLCCAVRDPLCRELMSARTHTTASTAQHPAGIELESRVFARMDGYELSEESAGIVVLGGKTGFTNEAGQCLATWAEDAYGKQYLAVVMGCSGEDPAAPVTDTLTLYRLIDGVPEEAPAAESAQ